MRALDLTGAIILDRDGRALAQQGRPDSNDFVRLGNVVETLQRWGYVLTSGEDRAGWSTDLAFAQQRPAVIGAVLMTACGCQKDMVVPFPPAPVYRAPLAPPLLRFFAEDGSALSETPQFSVREFVCEGVQRDDAKRVSRAVYRERL